MLSATGLVARYDDHIAVDHIDLTVGDGEVVCVLGPSGSGKSTLLRAIAGLTPIDDGTVCWDATDLAGVAPHQREFGLMFQDHALFPNRDVAGNVAFGLRMHGVPTAAARARVTELLDLVGLPGFERRAVRELSGGEQQRVALARALAPDPRLLMLDEPLGALDRVLREHLVTELRAIFGRRDRSILVVTHDHEEAFALADRVVVVRDGRVEQVGDAVAVWQAPANAFVAEFLGYNVTRAFGPLLAVRPDALTLEGAAHEGEGRTGAPSIEAVVVDRTFRRDHFRVRVQVRADADETLEVTVRDSAALDPGSPVRITLFGRSVVLEAHETT